MCGRGETKGVARPQPRGDKGTDTRGGRCVCKGGIQGGVSLQKIAKIRTVCVNRDETSRILREHMSSRLTAEEVRKEGRGSKGKISPRRGQRRRAQWPRSRA